VGGLTAEWVFHPRPNGRAIERPNRPNKAKRPRRLTPPCGLSAEDLPTRPIGRSVGAVWAVAFLAFLAYWAFSFSAVRPAKCFIEKTIMNNPTNQCNNQARRSAVGLPGLIIKAFCHLRYTLRDVLPSCTM
jgi:hypothetical protein